MSNCATRKFSAVMLTPSPYLGSFVGERESAISARSRTSPSRRKARRPDRVPKELLAGRPGDLLEGLRHVIPTEMQATIGVEDWSWTEHLCGSDGLLCRAATGARGDVENLETLRRERFE